MATSCSSNRGAPTATSAGTTIARETNVEKPPTDQAKRFGTHFLPHRCPERTTPTASVQGQRIGINRPNGILEVRSREGLIVATHRWDTCEQANLSNVRRHDLVLDTAAVRVPLLGTLECRLPTSGERPLEYFTDCHDWLTMRAPFSIAMIELESDTSNVAMVQTISTSQTRRELKVPLPRKVADRHWSIRVDPMGQRPTFTYQANLHPESIEDVCRQQTLRIKSAPGVRLRIIDDGQQVAATTTSSGGWAVPICSRRLPVTLRVDALGRPTRSKTIDQGALPVVHASPKEAPAPPSIQAFRTQDADVLAGLGIQVSEVGLRGWGGSGRLRAQGPLELFERIPPSVAQLELQHPRLVFQRQPRSATLSLVPRAKKLDYQLVFKSEVAVDDAYLAFDEAVLKGSDRQVIRQGRDTQILFAVSERPGQLLAERLAWVCASTIEPMRLRLSPQPTAEQVVRTLEVAPKRAQIALVLNANRAPNSHSQFVAAREAIASLEGELGDHVALFVARGGSIKTRSIGQASGVQGTPVTL